MSDLLVVYDIEVEIDVSAADVSTPSWARLGAGFNNLSEALNEVVQQYFELNNGGFASNYVTGMAPVYTMTGVRMIGDAAQDYIFDPDRKYGLLKKRNTTLRIKRLDSAAKIVTVTCPVTLANLSDTVGATTDGSAISCELRFNGKPTVETAK